MKAFCRNDKFGAVLEYSQKKDANPKALPKVRFLMKRLNLAAIDSVPIHFLVGGHFLAMESGKGF